MMPWRWRHRGREREREKEREHSFQVLEQHFQAGRLRRGGVWQLSTSDAPLFMAICALWLLVTTAELKGRLSW